MLKHETYYTTYEFLNRVVELTQAGVKIDTAKTRQIGGLEWLLFYEESESQSEPETVDEGEPSEDAGEGNIKELLDSLTKKADLLAFAKDNGLEVPEDMTQPASIKKHLKELL